MQRGARSRIEYKDVDEARCAYRTSISMKRNRRKHQKFLQGSRYKSIFFECSYEIDVRKYGGMIDLNITLDKDKLTTLKIRDLSGEFQAMKVIKEFSENSNKDSEARCASGDSGNMFAFGYNNSTYGDYVSMKDSKMEIRKYSTTARKLLDRYFKDEVREIMNADKSQKVTPSEAMGGDNGISAYTLVSRDLINAAHYDLDTSVGISIFTEKIPGKSTNWFFVLPNTTVNGKSDKKAVIIKLFDGCTLSWDGRKVYHCTATDDVGDGNHVYGNYWGGKKYR